MLKRRLVPKLMMRESRLGGQRLALVTTLRFDKTVEVGDPVSQAKVFQAQAADELVFLDLDAGKHPLDVLAGVLRRVTRDVFMPFTVGGGVRSTDDFRTLLANGADKVSVNTAALEEPGLIGEAADTYGAQCVVLSIDYRLTPEGPRVFTHNGRRDAGLDAVAWAREGARRGAGEILLTCIDRDGTGRGLDVATVRRVSEAVSVPVIASGGCGLARHFVEGFLEGRADAVAAGNFFSLRDQNLMQTRAHIRNAGVPIRLHR